MMFRRNPILMDGTPGAAGGGEAVAEAPEAGAPAAPAAAAPATTPPAEAPSALAPAPAPPSEFIPEKFRVMNGETLDVEASARKMAESYAGLEKRFGSGDAPPKTADDYTVTVPDALKESWSEDERFKAFRSDALAAGLTQKQFDFVTGKYFGVAGELVAGAINNTAEATREALGKAWGDNYDQQFTQAYAAFQAYADPEDRGKFDSIMTDPALAYRILAKIGPELREAGGIPAAATEAGGGEDIRALLTSEAATNTKHPDHKATRAKLDAYYAKKYGTAPIE